MHEQHRDQIPPRLLGDIKASAGRLSDVLADSNSIALLFAKSSIIKEAGGLIKDTSNILRRAHGDACGTAELDRQSAYSIVRDLNRGAVALVTGLAFSEFDPENGVHAVMIGRDMIITGYKDLASKV